MVTLEVQLKVYIPVNSPVWETGVTIPTQTPGSDTHFSFSEFSSLCGGDQGPP